MSGATACQKCSAGQYAATQALLTCSPCPVGRFAGSPGLFDVQCFLLVQIMLQRLFHHLHSSFLIVRISRRSDGLPELWSLVECKYVGTFQPLTGSICQSCLVHLCISQFYSGRQRGGFQILFSFQYVASTPAPGMLAVELACMHLSLGSELCRFRCCAAK